MVFIVTEKPDINNYITAIVLAHEVKVSYSREAQEAKTHYVWIIKEGFTEEKTVSLDGDG